MHPTPPRNLSRRDALKAGLATAGALALGGSTQALAGRALLAETPDASGAYGPFKMGLQSYSLRHFKLHDAMDMTKELGLHFWESFPGHIPADLDKAKDQREHAEGHGVKVIGYGVVPIGPDQDANRKLFEFAKGLGVDYLSIDPSPDSFDKLDKLVEEYGINAGIHNHGPGHRYATIDGIADAIKGHSERVGCCIDTGHFLRSKEDPVRAVEVFGKRIYGVHLKDVKDATTFTVLGKGDLRVDDLLKGLAKLKYKHCLALEYEEKEDDPMADLRACLETVRKSVAKL